MVSLSYPNPIVFIVILIEVIVNSAPTELKFDSKNCRKT
jgi:hypothetical protein